jgi:hypothetical protein
MKSADEAHIRPTVQIGSLIVTTADLPEPMATWRQRVGDLEVLFIRTDLGDQFVSTLACFVEVPQQRKGA